MRVPLHVDFLAGWNERVGGDVELRLITGEIFSLVSLNSANASVVIYSSYPGIPEAGER
jgi:hypothetical protein